MSGLHNDFKFFSTLLKSHPQILVKMYSKPERQGESQTKKRKKIPHDKLDLDLLAKKVDLYMRVDQYLGAELIVSPERIILAEDCQLVDIVACKEAHEAWLKFENNAARLVVSLEERVQSASTVGGVFVGVYQKLHELASAKLKHARTEIPLYTNRVREFFGNEFLLLKEQSRKAEETAKNTKAFLDMDIQDPQAAKMWQEPLLIIKRAAELLSFTSNTSVYVENHRFL